MRVLVAGASGFIGSELIAQLTADDHEIATLTRGEPRDSNQHRWNPTTGELDRSLVEWADAVVDFAGASISKLPWTKSYEKEILSSRLDATRTLTTALTEVGGAKSLLNASAVGFYGNRPAEVLTEESPRGVGFLADVVEQWERAAHEVPAETRVVTFRTGLVVGRGGAFGPLEFLTKWGLAARIGSGYQCWPWISLHDEAAAIRHLLMSSLTGAVNLEGPTPATAVHVTRALAKTMGRRHPWVLPTRLVKLTLGTAGDELLLSSQEAVPTRLLADGFSFRHETVDSAIAEVWG